MSVDEKIERRKRAIRREKIADWLFDRSLAEGLHLTHMWEWAKA